ncbi:predicted protein [Uncinocarpus reesii 1704]|uniref:Uncharacterized protein n=1 Tax=Uncinocarpus reesii (strain UAMH 1704) TaxID=336963 RepID=C4JLP2_UNCRE|nr:uncharacterized protein UREG_03750 [Uncinocarpus reesii 1704]EEP78904.1 predicted protein [Uncinocarpus reesii 1704]
MVLITPGTISVFVSTSVVGLFTFLLFLSGYVLQQQSVRNIQAALPRNFAPISTPKPNPPISKETAGARIESHFATGVKNPSLYDPVPDHKHGSQQAPIDGGIKKLSPNTKAYVQILTKPSAADICSTLLFAKALTSNSSSTIERIVIYPESWGSSPPSANIAAALRTLRASSERYNLTLYPMDMSNAQGGRLFTAPLLKKASAQFGAYERMLYLQAPGVVLDAEKLDQLMHPPNENDLLSEQTSLLWGWWADSKSKTWVRTQLKLTATSMPPAVLFTSRYLRPGVLSSHSHILGRLTRRSYVDSAMGVLDNYDMGAPKEEPAYVYFEKNKDRIRERRSVYYLDWRKHLGAVCGGLDLDD